MKFSLLRFAKQGICALRKKPFPLEPPLVIQFPVNDICNARCVMCNVWQRKRDAELSPAQIVQILDNPLFRNVQSVGINGGEPTLRKDLGDIVGAICENLPSLKTISLITNGLNSKQAINNIEQVVAACSRKNVALHLMISIDGVGETHDAVRGRPGSFDNAIKVLKYAKSEKHIAFVQIGCTVVRDNVYHLHQLHHLALEMAVPIKYRLGVPHKRLYRTVDDPPHRIGHHEWRDTHPFALDAEQKTHFSEFIGSLVRHYEKNEIQRIFYKSLMAQLNDGASRRAGCAWQHQGVTLTSRGEIAYCAVQSKSLGSALTEDSEKLYFGNKSYLNALIKAHCDSCAHDYLGVPGGQDWIRLKMSKLPATATVPLNLLRPAVRWLRDWKYRRSLLHKVNMQSMQTGRRLATMSSRVLVCGWYGTETLGDKAILGGVQHALNEALGKIELFIVSLFPHISRMTTMQMSELCEAKVLDIPQAFNAIQEADILVFGGGPLMSIKPMLEMEALFRAAKRAGVPTILAGCGVGPLGVPAYDKLVASTLEMADLRIFRDAASRAAAMALGVDAENDAVAEDPAFTWLHNNTQEGATPDGTSLLLGLRDWPHAEYAPYLEQAEALEIKTRAERAIVAALGLLVTEMPGLKLIPLPMCTNHYGGDDRFFYLDLFKGHPVLWEKLDMSMMGKELSPGEYLEKFRSASAALTMRFHSLVFARATGLPSVAIDYTLGKGKVTSLARDSGIPCQSFDALTPEFLAAELRSALLGGNKPNPVDAPAFPAALANGLAATLKLRVRAT